MEQPQIGQRKSRISYMGILFLVFLPFSYALTFNFGFPLKISEIALLLLVSSYLLTNKISVQNLNATKILLALIVWSTLSVSVNLFWVYSYPMKEYESRFGYDFDSILKLIYFLVSFISYIISVKFFDLNEKRAIKLILIGGTAASLYSWYLFLSGIVGIPEILLPGIKEPARIGTSFGYLIRSGTFAEGNFMGLFLIFSAILSFYSKRTRLGIYFLFSIIPTFSSIGFVCASLFIVLFLYKKYYNRRHLPIFIGLILAFIIAFIILMNQPDFNTYVISKFNFFESDVTSNADGSRLDRLNAFLTGIEMGIYNPIAGVGLSNYARHYDHYTLFNSADYTNLKAIPNNVYVEVFSETGFIGLLLFLFFLFFVYKATKTEETGTLKYGLISFLVYFMAYPTYTILYIWVFFGLIMAVYQKKRKNVYAKNIV